MSPDTRHPPRRPAVQASYMKDVFSSLEKRDQLVAIERADSELLARVSDASRASWLPVELNVRMVEALAGSCGEQRGLAILAECVYDQFGSPLWRNFVGGALRLLGRDPGSLGRWLPKAYQLLFRDCGDWSAERTADAELTVSVQSLPAPLRNHRLWLQSLAVGMTSLFTICNVSGYSELVHHDPNQATARYRLTWKPTPTS